MIIYMITATNNSTGEIDHVATSDAPFNHNPFEFWASTHTIEELEFDNNETNTLVRAREVLENIGHTTKQPNQRSANKIANIRTRQ